MSYAYVWSGQVGNSKGTDFGDRAIEFSFSLHADVVISHMVLVLG